MDVIGDGDWLPHSFDDTGQRILCVRVPAPAREALPFLSTEQLATGYDQAIVPTALVATHLEGLASSPVHFLFHTAFCCSTLAVNALDAFDGAVGLKEPAIFLDLVSKLERADALTGTQLQLVMRILGRPAVRARQVIVKPSCFTSALIPHVLQADPRTRVVLLHGDLRDFLLGVAKRGLRGRNWGRQVYASSLRQLHYGFKYTAAETLEQTDLQIAGLGWLVRRDYFERQAASFGAARVLQISARQVLEERAATLSAILRHLDMPQEPDAIERVINGPVFSRHSKEQRPFDAAARQAELDAARSTFGGEVEPVAQWIEKVAAFHNMGALSGLASD